MEKYFYFSNSKIESRAHSFRPPCASHAFAYLSCPRTKGKVCRGFGLGNFLMRALGQSEIGPKSVDEEDICAKSPRRERAPMQKSHARAHILEPVCVFRFTCQKNTSVFLVVSDPIPFRLRPRSARAELFEKRARRQLGVPLTRWCHALEVPELRAPSVCLLYTSPSPRD